MKLKTFLMAAVAAIVGLSVQAQSWTADAVGAGYYVLYNVGSAAYLQHGNGWGSQASVSATNPMIVELKAVGTDYAIRTAVNNDAYGLEHLSGSIYTDQSRDKQSAWTFTNVGTEDAPVYNIVSAANHTGGAGTYLTTSAGNTIVGEGTDGTSDYAKWKLMKVTDGAYKAALLTAMETATQENPVDVTLLIADANFGAAGDIAYKFWTMDAGNKNLHGGVPSNATTPNPCAESWRSAFTLSQVLIVPNGTYQLTAQAALTEYTATGANFPVVYANDETAPFKTMQNGESSMTAMAEQFTNGNYSVGPISVTVTNGTLTIGVRGTRTDTWCIWDNFQLKYLGLDLSDLKASLQAQIDAVPALEGTTTTAAYNAAKNYADGINMSSLTTEEAISAASTELSAYVDAAKAMQSAYASYVAFKNVVDGLDDDATIFTGDATIDVSAIDAPIQAATTLDALNAAIAVAKPQLQEAASAFIGAVTVNEGKHFDITNIYLTNADFEIPTASGKLPEGWTITITGQNCGQQNRTDTNPETGLAITNFIEAWHPSQLGNGVIAQTVSSLPEGTYVLECDASICHDPAGADDITGANLFIQSSLKTERQAISNVRLYINHYSLSFVHGGEGEVTFGLEANNTNANWLSADNFKVYFAGGIDYKSLLDAAFADFKALESSIDADIYAEYIAVVAEYNKEWSSKSEYQTAIAAVNQAIEDMQAATAAKIAYESALAAATTARDAQANVNVTGAELTALNAAIADAPNATAASYTEKAAALTTATTDFTAAVPAYNAYVAYRAETVAQFGEELAATVAAPTTAAEALVAVQNLNIAQYNKVASEYTFSATGLIGDFGTWTGTATYGEDRTPSTPNYLSNEHWSGQTHAYYEQCSEGWSDKGGWTIKYEKTCILPAGSYVIKVAARSSAGTTSLVSCSATGNTVTLPNVGASSKGINKAGEASWEDGEFVNSGNGFGWQWRFLPFTLTEQTEVTMTFYAEASSQYQWMSIADGELLSTTKLAQDVVYDEAAENEIQNTIIADVTINRDIKEGFNTVCLPFNLTANQVAAAFGDGTEVYVFSEDSENPDDVTINFWKNDGSINANTPVLVKATTASEVQVFSGVQIVAAESAKVEGTNFDFVGVYAPTTVEENDWFIGNGNLYKSAGTTNINAFRAFLDNKTGVSEVKMFIDGLATSISEIDNGQLTIDNGAIYNVAGQRVQKAQKGLYIVNGKKVVIK